MQYWSCFVEFVITNTAVQTDSKIGAGRESNSHSKFVVSSKYVHISADVILKAANANKAGVVAVDASTQVMKTWCLY